MDKIHSRIALILFYLVINGVNCQNKNNVISSTEIESLVRSFADESAKRGINVDVSPASLQIGLGRLKSKSGSCKPNSLPKLITIDSMLWKALSPQLKEMLVFHELAHCLLQRKHTNDVLASGECKSWMREDDSGCKINTVNTAWRRYYIDELFSAENLSSPDWYSFDRISDPADAQEVKSEKIITTKSDILLFDTLFFNTKNDWAVQMRLLEPKNFQGSLGIRINEYSIQLSSYVVPADPPRNIFVNSITLHQFKFRTDQNILYWDTLRPADKKFELSIKKIKSVVYVFFENHLQLCIPFDNFLSLSGYSSFKRKNPYVIRVYSSGSIKK